MAKRPHHKFRVEVPSRVRSACMKLRAALGVRTASTLQVGPTTLEDFLEDGGSVQPHILVKVQDRLKALGYMLDEEKP